MPPRRTRASAAPRTPLRLVAVDGTPGPLSEFESAFTHAGIGMALVSTDGRWMRVNPALCAFLGYDAEELMRRSFQQVTHPDDLDADLAEMQRLLAGTIDSYAMDKRYLRRDGGTVWGRLTVSLLRDAEGRPRHFISQVQDVTALHALEDRRREAHEHLAHIVATQQDIATAGLHDFDVMQLACDRAPALCGGDAAVVELLDGDDLVYRTASGRMARHVGTRLRVAASFSGLCALTGVLMRCDDTELDPRVDRETCRRIGVRSLLVLPLQQEHGVIGVLKVMSAVPGAFGPRAEAALRLLGGLVTAALRNATLLGLQQALLAERTAALDAMLLSEDRYRMLANASLDAVVVSERGLVTDANEVFARMFRLGNGDPRGRSVLDFVAAESRADVRARLAAGDEARYQVLGRRSDGTTFPLEVSARHLGAMGDPKRVTVLRDLSAERELDRMKHEFVSIVSHELRTPLTSIRGSLGLLEGGVSGPLAPKAGELVRIARTNADRLVRLVGDMLDMERIRSGKLELAVEPLDAGELVAAAVQGIEGMAVLHDVRLAMRHRALGAIAGDRDRLLQVLTNLLSNAIKFSPSGATVLVEVEDVDAAVRFTVEDRGPGIPADRVGRLFERFAQVGTTDSRRAGGTGLGLAISRGIVEQHGGRVGVESEPGVRTRIWMEVPVQAPS